MQREEWAKSFSGVLTDNYRDDCPTETTLPEQLLNLDREKQYTEHLKKPLNEHLEGQLMLFCKLNYPEEHKEDTICASAKPATVNQEAASKWIAKEQAAFMERTGRQ